MQPFLSIREKNLTDLRLLYVLTQQNNYTKSRAETTAYCSHFAIRQQGHIMFLSVTELCRCRINLQMKV